jgi:DNA-binding beta-propeller fold protein YncE
MRLRYLLLATALVTGCGAKTKHTQVATRPVHRPLAARPKPKAKPVRAPIQAVVTAETENALLVIDVPSARVLRRVRLAADPEDVAASGQTGVVLVVSSRAGEVTLLSRYTLRAVKVIGGFTSPHITAISPDGEHAFVTDDAAGTLTAIRLSDDVVTSRLEVGQGAHHLAFSPDGRWLWIALGESARQIVILDATNPDRPRLAGHFTPGFAAHDLNFTPDGRRVWITSATGPDVSVFDARDRHLLFRVPVGPPPQHLVFAGRYVYVTSGYGSVIEKVDAASGRILARTAAPYGSFELDAGHGYVVVSSLLNGRVAIYDPRLRLLRVRRLGHAAREVALSPP